MVSVVIRAAALIALIAYYSPMRVEPDPASSDSPLASLGLRKGLDQEDGSPEWKALTRLWVQIPRDARNDAADAVARGAAGALLDPASASPETARSRPAGDIAQEQRPREARRIYP